MSTKGLSNGGDVDDGKVSTTTPSSSKPDNINPVNNNTKDLRYPEMHYLLNERLSDVVFLVDGHRVPALKQLLSVKSDVFRAMFSQGFKESTQSEVTITTDDNTNTTTTTTNANAFKTMIQFAYTERLALNNQADYQHIHHVLKLADYYQLYRLMDACEQHLITMVDLDSVQDIGRLAFEYNMSDLIKVLRKFLDTNFNHFVNTKTQSELNDLNLATNNLFFEILTQNFLTCRTFFEPMTRERTFCPGAKNSYGYQEPSHYYYAPDAGQVSLFSFDCLHDNNQS